MFKIWFEALRPKTLPAAAAPVLMGCAMAFSDGFFAWDVALATLLSALLIQIGTNFANDYFDFKKGADNEDRLGPTRATQAGLIKPQVMKRAYIFTLLAAFFVGLYLVYIGGWPILAIGLASLLFAVLYTGGPYPLGYNGLGDIFVLIFFGPVAVGGTYYVQALQISESALLAGLAPGLISTAILAINNLRDVDTDRVAGKRTLAVRFGTGFARSEYILALLSAFILPYYLLWSTGGHVYVIITTFGVIVAFPSVKAVLGGMEGRPLNNVLANTGKTLAIYSILFSIGWII